jgi:hypothetical protein
MFVRDAQEREGVRGAKPLGLDLRVLVNELAEGMGSLNALGAGGEVRAHDEKELGQLRHDGLL